MNFAPRVTIPFLMINGRDDFNAPPAARERFIELLGTPAAQKQLVVLEGGHFPHDIRGLVRHTLDWFYQYSPRSLTDEPATTRRPVTWRAFRGDFHNRWTSTFGCQPSLNRPLAIMSELACQPQLTHYTSVSEGGGGGGIRSA